MTSGTVYSLKVRARNNVGLGAYSEALSVLAAQDPDKVINLSNVSG
jgi:hypothetical protein